MRRMTCGAVAVVVALASAGCRPEPPEPKVLPRPEIGLRPEKGFRKKPGRGFDSPERDAVYAALKADADAYTKAVEKVNPKTPPSVIAKALKDYVTEQAAIPVEGCPEEFRDEFDKYRKASKSFADALARIPDDFEGNKFNELLKEMYRGDFSKKEVLGGDVEKSIKAVNTSLTHMHRAVLNFGIEADL